MFASAAAQSLRITMYRCLIAIGHKQLNHQRCLGFKCRRVCMQECGLRHSAPAVDLAFARLQEVDVVSPLSCLTAIGHLSCSHHQLGTQAEPAVHALRALLGTAANMLDRNVHQSTTLAVQLRERLCRRLTRGQASHLAM